MPEKRQRHSMSRFKDLKEVAQQEIFKITELEDYPR